MSTPAHARPTHAQLEMLCKKAISEGVEAGPSTTPHPDWMHTFEATSSVDGLPHYTILIHAPDPLGVDTPILCHCDCQAGQYARPCKHLSLSLHLLFLDMTFSEWLCLDAEQAKLGPHVPESKEESA